ncbi:hypothetical protein ACH5RR_004331 [Cinchona calisaya]|uniref:Uncharacterized protein n=1 Tax=Cinchona calisaya TaxID=153742 RepID=A0ABD3AX87_9GENT
MQHQVHQSSERSSPSEVVANSLTSRCPSDELGQNKPKYSDDNSQISMIVQLMKGNTFFSDVSDVQREKRNEIQAIAGRAEGVLLTPFPKTSDERIQRDMKKAIIRTPTVLLQSSASMTLSLVL